MAKRTIPPASRLAKEKSSYSRQLKVRKGSYPYQYSPRRPYCAPEPVPWIEIKGYWLKQVGFTVGVSLSVKVQEGCIIITPQDSPR